MMRIWPVLFCPFCWVAAKEGIGESFQWGVNGHSFLEAAYWQVPVATQLDLVVELGVTRPQSLKEVLDTEVVG